jgi:hypothetical protein
MFEAMSGPLGMYRGGAPQEILLRDEAIWTPDRAAQDFGAAKELVAGSARNKLRKKAARGAKSRLQSFGIFPI